jgi:hypothetical protein
MARSSRCWSPGRLFAFLHRVHHERQPESLYNAVRGSNGKKHAANWQEGPPENRHQGQTLPLCQMPPKKPEACQDSRPLVLPELPEYGGEISLSLFL